MINNYFYQTKSDSVNQRTTVMSYNSVENNCVLPNGT